MFIFETRYYDTQTKIICQNYNPGKLVVQLIPTRPQSFGASSPRVRFLDVYGFSLFLNNKNSFEPHCNTIQNACSHHIASQR